MSAPYLVIDAAGLVVNVVLLDADDVVEGFDVVEQSVDAGIGWRRVSGILCPPEIADSPPSTHDQISAEIDALQAKLDALREASV